MHMEKKNQRKTIDRAIYILIGAMLLCMLLVSVLTATLRRGERHQSVDTTAEETTGDVKGGRDTASDSRDNVKVPAKETSAPETEKARPSVTPETEEQVQVSVGIRYYVLPVEGSVSKPYEMDVPVYSTTMNDYRAHTGVDIAAPVGSTVVAVEDGTVCRVWNDPMMGSCVSVDHGDSIISTYMNLTADTAEGIEVGAKVTQGQPLGAIGETSLTEIAEEAHLHLEMKVGGDFVDPIEYLGIEGLDEVYEG